MIIHRLSGETYRAITVAPEWSVDKLGVHNAILELSKVATRGRANCFPATMLTLLNPPYFHDAEGVAF